MQSLLQRQKGAKPSLSTKGGPSTVFFKTSEDTMEGKRPVGARRAMTLMNEEIGELLVVCGISP